jgi:hypothetical protein
VAQDVHADAIMWWLLSNPVVEVHKQQQYAMMPSRGEEQ